jgi:sporulation protein YlmC with PRC-barrel domain
VLLAPRVFVPSPLNSPYCSLNLTSEQVKNSPSIALHKPISRQFEEEHYRSHGWPDYWKGDGLFGLDPTQASVDNIDAHLRSARALCGYRIQTAEGTLGHVRDFIVDEKSWSISHLLIETGNWLWGKEIIIPMKKIDRISYDESLVFVSVTKDNILESPEYDRPWARSPSSLFAGELPPETNLRDSLPEKSVENKNRFDANSSFTLFPDACPTGDTSGYQPPLCDLIKKRAYELFEQSGRMESSDLQNWLRAEREVKHHLGV